MTTDKNTEKTHCNICSTNNPCPDCLITLAKNTERKNIMTTEKDFEELKELCRDLLDGANKCSQPPHYIVQPFLNIVKRHVKLINKYQLTEKRKHDLWKTGDEGVPSVICDGNGEVVLAYCKTCKGAEGCLPTNCPGRILAECELEQITKGELDF